MTSDKKIPGIDLDEVIQGFVDSQKTLASLSSELEQISRISAEQDEAKAALLSVSQQVAEFARQAGLKLADLSDAQSQVESVLRAGAAVLSGSQLAQVTSQVGTLEASVDAMRTELVNLKTETQASIDQLSAKFETSEQNLQSTLEELAESIGKIDARVSQNIFGRIF